VRLVIDEDEDATVVDDTGAEFPVSLVDGPFVDVDFAVEDNRRSEEALTLTLDLRQSLAFDDDTDEYTLEPVLRSVRTENAASVSGTVGVECPSGTTLAEGGAVYLYSGSDLEPDDIDGTGVEPYATTRVRQDTLGGDFTYDLRALPSGRYTLAFTCKGDADDLDQNEVLDFSQVQNVSLDSGESLELDLD
jgi:hypothetical protein